MSDQFPFDVFLSHNSKDKPRVRRLAERLKQAGLLVWFDDWNIEAGDIISLKVDEGLEESRVLLLCISPDALDSGWVALERSKKRQPQGRAWAARGWVTSSVWRAA